MELGKREFLAGAFGLAAAAAASAAPADKPETRERFNVRDFGAKGDGKTPDSAAIQRALDAAGAATGTVWFPPGVYLCHDLKVPPYVTLLADPVWIYRQETAGATLQLDNSKAACILDVTGAFAARINGLVLVGRAKTPKPVHGIFLNNPEKWSKKEDTLTIDNCKVSGFSGNGIYLFRIWLFIIRHCMLAFNAGAGVKITGWDGFVLDNQLSGNGGCGFECEYIGATVMFTANRVEWNRQAGLRICSGDAWNVTGNCFDRNHGPGLEAIGVKASTVTGNVFRRCGASGAGVAPGEPSCQIRLVKCSGLTVTGNTCQAGVDDGGKGKCTPQAGFVIKEVSCSAIALNALASGYTEKMVADLGGNGKDLILKDNVGSV